MSEETERDLAEVLRGYADAITIVERPCVTGDLMREAADEIECYRGMKDGFEIRAKDYEDVIDNLTRLLLRCSYAMRDDEKFRTLRDQAVGSIDRKGLANNPHSILREDVM